MHFNTVILLANTNTGKPSGLHRGPKYGVKRIKPTVRVEPLAVTLQKV